MSLFWSSRDLPQHLLGLRALLAEHAPILFVWRDYPMIHDLRRIPGCTAVSGWSGGWSFERLTLGNVRGEKLVCKSGKWRVLSKGGRSERSDTERGEWVTTLGEQPVSTGLSQQFEQSQLNKFDLLLIANQVLSPWVRIFLRTFQLAFKIIRIICPKFYYFWGNKTKHTNNHIHNHSPKDILLLYFVLMWA